MPVLRGIDLTIRAGECLFLAGPSGSGKTTLLSILGGILQPDRGRVWLCGEELTAMAANERIEARRRRIGFVFQRFHLIRGLTATENVSIPLALQGIPQSAAQRRARELLSAVGLADHLHAHPSKMSTGQCQRVALARALATEPDIILADEPTASLDEAMGQSVMALMRQLTVLQGKAAVVVTHDPRIYHFADRICRMEGGHVVDQVTADESKARQSVSQCAEKTPPC